MECKRLGFIIRSWMIGAMVLVSFPNPAGADDRLGGLIRGLKRTLRGGKEVALERVKPDACTHPNVEELAGQIDWLEHHLELYGSAIAKQPNIWGEARLTRHREEIERELAAKVTAFTTTFQAALSSADAASAAFNASINNPGSTTTASATATATATTNQALTLEPGIQNQQLFRYLNSLNTLRRINEGDDIADSPGYAMNLLRVPVSILPGKRTRQGYGADISMTLHPALDEDLLPKTFRSLVVNDQVDQLSLSMVRLIEGDRKTPGRGIEGLLQYAEAEHIAQPTIEQLLTRLDEIEQQAPGNAFSQRVRSIQEYLRSRIIQIFWLASRGAPADNLVERRYEMLDLTIEVSLPYDRLKDLLPKLLRDGYGLVTLDVALETSGQPKQTIPLTILVAEVEDFSSLNGASLPYRFWVPFGPVCGSLLPKPRRQEIQGADLCRLQRKGMLHLELAAKLLNENAEKLKQMPSGEDYLLAGVQLFLEELDSIDGFCPIPIDSEKFIEIVAKVQGSDVPKRERESLPVPALLSAADPVVLKNGPSPDCDPANMIGPETTKLIRETAANAFGEWLRNVLDQRSVPAIAEQAAKIGSQMMETLRIEVSKIVSAWNAAADKCSRNMSSSSGGLYDGNVSQAIAANDSLGVNSSSILPGFTFSSSSALRARKATQALSPSVQGEVYGSQNLATIVRSLDEALRYSPQNNGNGRLLIDVRTYLNDELQTSLRSAEPAAHAALLAIRVR